MKIFQGYFDTLIGGAGIMGMGLALEEALRGKKVAIWDKFLPGQKASWASAGILTNRDARIFHSPFRAFQIQSQDMYPKWLEKINSAVFSKDSPYKESLTLQNYGAYQIFPDDAQGERDLNEELAKLKREGAKNYTLETSAPSFIQQWLRNPQLPTLHFPNEAYISNRQLLVYLQTACENLGVVFLPSYEFDVLIQSKEQITVDLKSTAIHSHSNSQLRCEGQRLVICAGIGSQELLKNLGYQAPLVPVKGQAFSVEKFYTEKAFIHYGKEVYMVPRSNDILVGVTTENHNADEVFNAEGEKEIREQLTVDLPLLAKKPAIESWAGVRPRTKDRLPLMGWINESKTLALCAGHYKSGIGMAPLSALCMSQLLNFETPSFDITPFDPLRKKGLKPLG